MLGLALLKAYEDLGVALGPDVDAWRYDRLHTATHRHAMTDVPILGDWLNVGPYGLPAAKDALCKYEFKLKRDVDYSIFSGPSKRIGSTSPMWMAPNILPPASPATSSARSTTTKRRSITPASSGRCAWTAPTSRPTPRPSPPFVRKRTADAHRQSHSAHPFLLSFLDSPLSMRLRLTALLFLLLGFTMVSRAQSEAPGKHIESNWGLATIDGLSSGALFPGTSLLVGRRMFIGNTTFFEGQFAFLPS